MASLWRRDMAWRIDNEQKNRACRWLIQESGDTRDKGLKGSPACILCFMSHGLFRRIWSEDSPFIPHHKLKRRIKKFCAKVAIVVFNSTKTNVKGLITEEWATQPFFFKWLYSKFDVLCPSSCFVSFSFLHLVCYKECHWLTCGLHLVKEVCLLLHPHVSTLFLALIIMETKLSVPWTYAPCVCWVPMLHSHCALHLHVYTHTLKSRWK